MTSPWLPKQTLDWLNEFLNKPRIIFEYGSGNSTIYLDKRAKLISIEHDERWYKKIKTNLKSTEYHLVHPKEYPEFITKYPKNHFDLIIIDGLQREECMKFALPHIKKGGYLLLDDSQREKYNKVKQTLSGNQKKVFQDQKEELHESTIWKI